MAHPQETVDWDDDSPVETKPKARGINASDFQRLVTDEAMDAKNYVDEALSYERALASDYYEGRLPDVDKDTEEEDRSTAVLTEVRDTVLGMMPDMLRIFLGADGVCQYLPVPVEDPALFAQKEALAKQATDYVQHIVLKQDNPDSFTTFRDAFEDGLVRKTGFIRWWWEKVRKPEFTTYTGLSEDIAVLIASADDVEVVGKRTYVDQNSPLGPAVLYDMRIKRICDHGRVRIAAVPCENIFVARRGRSVEHTPLFGYSEQKTLSEFEAMGFSAADLADCDEKDDEDSNIEKQARRPTEDTILRTASDPTQDKSQKTYTYSEIYILADKDGDGIAELIRCECAGTRYKVLNDEPCEEVQFSAFSPYPAAHQFFGKSVADLTMDIQRIKSRILRDVLDSLAQSVKPQTAVVEGKVNLDDVLNPDTSNVIRMQGPGMVQPLTVPFVGKEGMPMLDYMTNVREARTGMSDASQGLDPKVLQSTDKQAVQATLTKAQARIEMVARIFAETGMKRLFRGILKLITRHQDVKRMVTLRGKAVPVDPTHWDPGMDVDVDLPLGRGSTQDQLSFLVQVLAKQEAIIQMLGPNNPMCSLEQYFYTLSKIVQLGGWPNVRNFFADPAQMTDEQRQQISQGMEQSKQAAAPTGPAPPDPAIEKMKLESQERIKAEELAFKREELVQKTGVEMAKLKMEAQMRAAEIEAAHATTVDKAVIEGHVKAAVAEIHKETAVLVERLKPRPTPSKSGGGGD
jgi:hypothetical protein